MCRLNYELRSRSVSAGNITNYELHLVVLVEYLRFVNSRAIAS
ncbi:hypothetical protein [Nodularia sp. UHCC 0506]|nr:hypothetical protein [Nodularia sp. UHCC 0506]MEA5513836.1 hypothetical protein [Nodularia sp. UHCC 0506]